MYCKKVKDREEISKNIKDKYWQRQFMFLKQLKIKRRNKCINLNQ